MSCETIKDQMLQAMRRLASSVTIISSSNGDERHAMAATAVNSLSTEPPSILICVNKTASIHKILDQGADFCVNVLAHEQEELSILCGGKAKGEARFETGNWAEAENGVPYLTDAQSALLCETDGKYSYGTHTIFIGRIKKIHNSEEISPLIYVDGGYTTSAEATAV